MATFFKSLKWIAFAALALFSAIALSWWLIPDEVLNPRAAGFVAQPATPPSARNASFMIWGLPASPELDAHTVGPVRWHLPLHQRLQGSQVSMTIYHNPLIINQL